MLADGGEMTEETEFKFKTDVDMNALTKQIGEGLADAIGSDPSKIKCKGVRIFYVNEDEMLMSSGLFVKGFSPENWYLMFKMEYLGNGLFRAIKKEECEAEQIGGVKSLVEVDE